eukprot:2565463-Amphidinium_carterae.1
MDVGRSRSVCCVWERTVSSNESCRTTESRICVSPPAGLRPEVKGSGAAPTALAALLATPEGSVLEQERTHSPLCEVEVGAEQEQEYPLWPLECPLAWTLGADPWPQEVRH